MARLPASARPTASARNTASARAATTCYRIPIEYYDLGITRLWDFRDGFTGAKTGMIKNMMGKGDMFWRGGTAISTALTTGTYAIDLERLNDDYLSTNPMVFTNGMTAFTVFAWIKLESNGGVRHIITQWEPTTNQRGFELRMQNNDTLELGLSVNGTAQTFYATTETLTDTSGYHFVTFSYDTTNRGQATFDKVAQTVSLISGSAPASINSSNTAMLIGANNPASPANIFDGFIGICGICEGTVLTSAQIAQLYNFTNSVGNYV